MKKRVVFMGSPDFAVPSLEALAASDEYEVTLVVTQTDKPQGRRQVLTPPPVKETALRFGLPVYQPKTLKTEEAAARIAAEAPDFIVVAAYGKILPQAVLDIPRFGCVNLHGSLLPKYRGAAPIQWSVINGEKTTGVTSMLMNAGLDTGDILLTAETRIGENETAGELFDRLAAMCPALLLDTLRALAAGTVTPVPQNDADATYVRILTKEDAVVDWSLPVARVHDLVRGLNPWPVAVTSLDGKRMKIYAGAPARGTRNAPPGSLFSENGRLFAVCGENGVYEIAELQLEGAKRLPAADFLRGHDVRGVRLGGNGE